DGRDRPGGIAVPDSGSGLDDDGRDRPGGIAGPDKRGEWIRGSSATVVELDDLSRGQRAPPEANLVEATIQEVRIGAFDAEYQGAGERRGHRPRAGVACHPIRVE